MRCSLLGLLVLASAVLYGAGPEMDEMLVGVPFRPAYMDGEFTALQRFSMRDMGRLATRDNPKIKEYLSGYDCFSMSFKDGIFTIDFNKGDKTPKEYFKSKISITNESTVFRHWGICPAPNYRVTCEFKLNKGEVEFCGRKFSAGNGKWQKISFLLPENVHKYQERINLYPEPGYSLSIKTYSIRPVYPVVKDAFIRLQDGGKLTAIQMPENASETTRIALIVWRAWLWKVTGIALPFKTVKKVTPLQGTLSAVSGKDVKEGWQIEADKNGIRVVYSDEKYILPSCTEYMRQNGVRLYADECRIIPKPNKDLVLKGMKENFNSFFKYFSPAYTSSVNVYNSYKADYYSALAANVNWYTSPSGGSFHFWNTFLPYEKYGKTHPEYWMKLSNGKYQKEKNTFLMTPCLSNPESRKIILHNVVEAVKASGDSCTHTCICLGDSPEFCQCDGCKAFTKDGSVTDLMVRMQNDIAKALKDAGLKTRVCISAYHNYSKPPQKFKLHENVNPHICMQWRLMRCQVHVDCPVNRPYFPLLEQWKKAAGDDKGRVGYCLYFDERPYHMDELFDFLGKYGNDFFHFYAICDDTPVYFFSRWNYGRNNAESRKSFYQDYFGPGGKYVDEAYRMVDQWCKNYKHTKDELESSNIVSALPYNPKAYKTVLTRDILDKVYALMNKAEKMVSKDSAQYRNILYHKYTFMVSDICKYDRASCHSKEELALFADRLAELIRIISVISDPAKPAYYNRRIYDFGYCHVKPRKWFEAVSGIAVPTTKEDWIQEPVVQKFLKNPRECFKFGPAKIAGGWHFAPHAMLGGDGVHPYSHECPLRITNGISRQSSGKGRLAVQLELKKIIEHPTFLSVDGLDDDKPGASTFDILVNGKKIYSGPNTFPEHEWGRMTFNIPAGSLKAGSNTIEFVNTMPDLPSDKRVEILKGTNGEDMGQVVKINYQRGWICIADIRIYDVNGELKKMFAGEPGEWEVKHRGKVENGVLKISGDQKAYFCGGYWLDPPQFNAQPSGKIRIKGEVEGTPWISIGCACIVPPHEGSKKKFPALNVKGNSAVIHPNGKSIKFDRILTIPPETVRLMPSFGTKKGSKIILKSLTYEIVP